MKQGKKKKRSRPSKQVNGPKKVGADEDNDETRVLKSLMEAFTSVSMDEAVSAYEEAKGDPNKAAEILGGLDDRPVSCSSYSGSCSTSSSDMFGSTSSSEMCVGNASRPAVGKPKKKIVAATGMVSTVLGKDYVSSMPKKGKCLSDSPASKEELEQFLCSMLGDDCELSMGVVRDVLCQCKYDVEQALSVLLELSASSTEKSASGRCSEDIINIREDTGSLHESSDYLTDRTFDSTSHSSESDLQDNVWSMGYNSRNYFDVLVRSDAHSSTTPKVSESELPWKVLESLFNTPRSSEHKPNTMNWRNVVKKMETLGQSAQFCISADDEQKKQVHAEGDEYRVCRESARQHWVLMKSCYQKAATAYSKGERDYAAYMSDKGRTHNKIAREADEKASQDIFQARNKSIENVVTIDLHGQHVKQAMKLLKLHLLFGAYVRSVRWFRVITGCGSHGLGKSKLKQSVTNLLQKEGIHWSEENRGTLIIRLDGQTEFSFLDTDSDTE